MPVCNRHPDGVALPPRHRGRRRMGWLGALVDGMGAGPRPSRPRCFLAAIRRPGRPLPRQSCGPRFQSDVGRCLHRLGLAHPLLAQHHPRRNRPLDSPWHRRNADLSASRCRAQNRTRAFHRGLPQAAERDFSLGLRPHVGAGAILYFTAFIFAYGSGMLHLSRDFLLIAVLVASCVSFVSIPVSGHLR